MKHKTTEKCGFNVQSSMKSCKIFSIKTTVRRVARQEPTSVHMWFFFFVLVLPTEIQLTLIFNTNLVKLSINSMNKFYNFNLNPDQIHDISSAIEPTVHHCRLIERNKYFYWRKFENNSKCIWSRTSNHCKQLNVYIFMNWFWRMNQKPEVNNVLYVLIKV